MENLPLVLVHGYPFDHSLWDAVVAALGEGFDVLTPDLPGFGGRAIGEAEPSLDRMADDLKAVLDQRDIRRAVVAGMSMGGYVALSFAERHPDRLAGLGLISSQSSADTDEARANRRAMIDKVRLEGAGVAAQAIIPKLFSRQNSSREDLTRFPIRGAERAGVEGITWALEAMARRPDRTLVLKSMRVPVLIVHGAEDQFTPAELARELAAFPADAKFVEISQAGHGTPLEAPVRVADALKELVQRCSRVSEA